MAYTGALRFTTFFLIGAPAHVGRNHSRSHRQPQSQAGRVRQDRFAARTRTEHGRTRHFLGHVVGTLLLQIVAHAPEHAADHGRPGRAGAGRNAGVIDIGEGWCIAFKIESHNHPSFIEPFQGAATGVGGILRDVFTMGARPVALMNSLRFGPLDDPKHGARNRAILDGVVRGIGTTATRSAARRSAAKSISPTVTR